MKVRCIKRYFDLKMERYVDENEEYEVSEARVKELMSVGVPLVEIIEAPKKKAPAKKKEAK